jgi:outer membrane lipoprotein
MRTGRLRVRSPTLPAAVLLVISACATSPEFDTAGVDTALTPARVAVEPKRWIGSQVLWGGVILAITNLQDSTRLEVLSQPLDRNMRPKAGAAGQGRFVIQRAGYLEPATYAPDRRITVTGTLNAVEAGKVGEATAALPVVVPRQLYLWPEPERGWHGSGVHFGIGIGISF